MNEKRSRYRAEDGVLIIDVRLASVERLFDNRDPAPFRERDLDPSLVEYLIDACHDMATRPFRIVFWLEQTSQPAGVEAAVRAHFAYDLVRLDRDRGIQRRIGWIALSIASVAIVALIGVSNLIAELVTGHTRRRSQGSVAHLRLGPDVASCGAADLRQHPMAPRTQRGTSHPEHPHPSPPR
jgi:hypothetical protein